MIAPSGINSLKLSEHWLSGFWGFSKIPETKNAKTFCVLELGHFMHEMSLISHKLSKAVATEISSVPNISMGTYHPWVPAYLSPLLWSLLWSPNLIRCSQPLCLWTPLFSPFVSLIIICNYFLNFLDILCPSLLLERASNNLAHSSHLINSCWMNE